MEFCKKCGSIMIPEKRRKNTFLKCRSCGYEIQKNIHGLRIVEEKKAPKGIVVLEKDETILPVTDKACEKCDNPKAHWWLQQTRSADEPPTQFFRCTKCRHVWREYK
ncbi:MAG: transcription factor S [Candidatus Aenigmarchaeota archaeon]|nr:transcription factor S [Candidatus Aenigmarchaeota archaeon]